MLHLQGWIFTKKRNPFEVVKSQVQVGWNNTIPKTISHIYQNEGIGGFWVGFQSFLFREIPFMCIQFPIYEILRKRSLKIEKEVTFISSSINGFIAGAIAGLLTTPIDVIKTKLMTQRDNHYKSFSDCALKVSREEGLMEFSKGGMIRMITLGICGNIFFGIYEKVKGKLMTERPF